MHSINHKLFTLVSSSILILLPATLLAAKYNKPSVIYNANQKASSKVLKTAEHIRDRYIVIFKETSVGPKSIYSTGNLKADVDDLADTLNYRHGGTRDKTWHKAVKGMAAHLTAQQAEKLANDPDVALVEEDGVVHANATQNSATWGLDRIDQINLPLDNTYSYTNAGAGVTAYIIDTGIHITHQEFGSRASWGTNITGDRKNDDCNGHGTHVAGTVGGATYGVAKGVNLVAVKVLGCTGSGSTSGVIAGIDWVTNNKKPNSVANMSLGGGYSAALNNAVTNSINAGVVYAVAAGNSNADACLESPSSTPTAITVGATESTDARASYSNYGSCLDIFAPGTGITSSWYTSNTATNTISGTSMATPHVVGAAALYLSAYPGSTPAQVTSGLLQIANNNLVSNPLGSPNKLLYTNLAPPDLIAPNGVSLDTPLNANSLSGTVSLTATASDNVGISKVEFYANGSLIGTATKLINSTYSINWNTTLLINGPYDLTVKAFDFSGNTTSSLTSISVSINNTAPTCQTMNQAIIDSSFESQSAAWINTNVFWNLGTGANTGSWIAWLGGYGFTGSDDLYQEVTIPADACAANFSFMIKITTSERASAGKNDNIAINVTSATGTVLSNLANYSNKNASTGFALKTFDLLAYKGQTIRLQFHSVENGSRQTSFYIDDVTLK